jgi:hypothetical protein
VLLSLGAAPPPLVAGLAEPPAVGGLFPLPGLPLLGLVTAPFVSTGASSLPDSLVAPGLFLYL